MNVELGVSDDLLPSRFGFDETLERLRAAIAERGLWVIAELDPQALLKRDGLDIPPARQLLFFHPRYASRVLAADPAALIDAPLKLLVLSLPDGRVGVRAVDPSPRLARISADLGELPREVLAAVTGRSSYLPSS
jgi:uncharacterized protein (DUF302 family)